MQIIKIIICQQCFEKIQPMIDSCSHCQSLEKLDSEQFGKRALIFMAGFLFGVMIVLYLYIAN